MPPHELSTLPAGERVVSERIDGVRSASLGLWIGVGSRDEPDAKAGVSHFIEHLLFKGSARYGAVEIAEIFDSMGAELNAATSRETTLVYTRVPDDHVELALDVMLDMVFSPTFAELDAEREVVLEEIAMLEDDPQELVHDLAGEAVFGSHPLGRSVIGRAEVISAVGKRALRGYHRSAYASPNVVLAAAGNLDHDLLVHRIAARREPRSTAARPVRRTLTRTPPPGLRFLEKSTEQYHVCLAAPGIASGDERRYAASLLDAIVGGSASSRLFQEIREKRGLAYSVYSFGSSYADAGEVGFYLGTRPENLPDAVELAVGELSELGEGRLRPGELERAKENVKGRLLLSLESTSARMTRLGRALVTGIELVSIDETLRRIDAVEPEHVAALAAGLLAPSRLSAAGIGPSRERFEAAVGRVNPELLARAA